MKRLLDIALASVAFFFLFPVMLVLAYFIRQRMGSPVLFTQERPGLRGVPFRLMKFRSMTDATDESGRLLPDGLRMTRFGSFLRSTSLDELPSLINILKGEMSLVGPRPLLMRYLPLYSAGQFRRHEVKPGLTGWAQIMGRNAISWDEKFAYDIWYVDNRSLWLDLKILALTVKKVLRRDGISSEGEATMPEFKGSAQPEQDGAA